MLTPGEALYWSQIWSLHNFWHIFLRIILVRQLALLPLCLKKTQKVLFSVRSQWYAATQSRDRVRPHVSASVTWPTQPRVGKILNTQTIIRPAKGLNSW